MKQIIRHSFVFLLAATMLIAAPRIYREMGVPAWVRTHIFHREAVSEPGLADQDSIAPDTTADEPPAVPDPPKDSAAQEIPSPPAGSAGTDPAPPAQTPPDKPAQEAPDIPAQQPLDPAPPAPDSTTDSFSFPDEPVKPEDPFSNALFIGDSRTVGIAKYAGIEGADFYACTGMSVYSAWKEESSVGSWGKSLLADVLQSKQYDRIFLMLGINELGYNMDKTVETHAALVARIRELQPKAYLMICANMHVTQKRSSSDKIYNNARIDQLNTAFSALADGKSIFYLDVNPVFDDENGALGAQYTQDNTHILGKYYSMWKDFLGENTPA